MLVIVVELDVAASEGLGSDAVVFDMIGAQTKIAIVNIDIVFREVDIAILGLGTAGRYIRNGAGWSGKMDLLSARERNGK